ncbi:SRPBCC domain-containing protein [Microbacterium sp. MEC084]|uniref:SRPBCC family protein n=1 Tax=unclassified Microbacterium TaxID=2609290 RepID=UPI0006FF2B00|nr:MULTISPECIES: SRPBCC domain-containing protein [unclassified Microbacterium]KQY98712.1 polyketide cyclase [Microbacterium sp. Root53]MCD1268684.1 SRPBCC domain-containing protein [Microbacterium sp. MEC084]
MTFIEAVKDPDALTMTMVAEFDRPAERVWKLWEDPRQLERWWGPPGWPATFTRHDFAVPGRSTYYMSGPEGEKAHGWWSRLEIAEPTTLRVEDGFADENGDPTGDLGSTVFTVTLEPTDGGGTRMSIASQFESAEQLQAMVDMGMEEGMKGSLGQIDAILAED